MLISVGGTTERSSRVALLAIVLSAMSASRYLVNGLAMVRISLYPVLYFHFKLILQSRSIVLYEQSPRYDWIKERGITSQHHSYQQLSAILLGSSRCQPCGSSWSQTSSPVLKHRMLLCLARNDRFGCHLSKFDSSCNRSSPPSSGYEHRRRNHVPSFHLYFRRRILRRLYTLASSLSC